MLHCALLLLFVCVLLLFVVLVCFMLLQVGVLCCGEVSFCFTFLISNFIQISHKLRVALLFSPPPTPGTPKGWPTQQEVSKRRFAPASAMTTFSALRRTLRSPTSELMAPSGDDPSNAGTLWSERSASLAIPSRLLTGLTSSPLETTRSPGAAVTAPSAREN